MGISYIEGGWPGSNPKAVEFFDRMKKVKLKQAKLTAFGSTMRKNSKKAQEDANLAALIQAETPAVVIFGKSWDLHVKDILKISLDKNLELISESIKYLKSKKKEVIYDAEHFYDGYKNNPEYALKTLKAARDAGADIISLCDTNGGALPQQTEQIMEIVLQEVPGVDYGVHMHNDTGCAVANSLMAVQKGAVHVQGTINGIGERCGNADLCAIIPGLQLRMNKKVLSEKQLKNLTPTSHHIAEIANQPLPGNKPYVGYSAFAHKAGVHVDAMQKNRLSYEHIDPELVGNGRRVLISELSGKSNLLAKAESMGIRLKGDDQGLKALLDQIKRLEHYGYQFEEGEASFELLVRKQIGKYENLFELISLHVNNDKHDQEKELSVEASLKVRVNGDVRHTVADGNGPVAAMDKALRKALAKSYPEIDKIHLQDYKVRVLDSNDGTEAVVRVLIKSTDGDDTWGTVGVSTNIIEASWKALIDSIEYKLNRK
jgi:2-isopropylmalate synthase